ncbi:DUF488 family protein [Tabrizicola sp.]|uniref:DUF488 domain-containing protein n=1 Tax=Tabrizicola sp. TaxID=2005166 RepID=UPI001A4C9A9F|nr:DUF488 domain-containing protein [Tabrizicola sp.]MBL9062600.1 DUF488 domain-containing protein [Tabrizicola sp.]
MTWPEFIARIDAAEIGCIIDVRSFPRSRLLHFNQPQLRTCLNRRGIAYVHLGDQLGGNVTDHEASYTRRTTMPSFLAGIERVLEIAARCRPALLCAEGEVLDCHRFFVLSRYLAQHRAVEIIHIRRDGSAETHAEAEDRFIQRANRFGDLFFDREEILEIAYMAKLLKMGLKP